MKIISRITLAEPANCPARMRAAPHNRGISLIETLVTLVVISIGMLGIAALYVESLKAGNTAVARTRAVALASDMADRIRSNPAAGVNYTADVTAAAANPPFACADTGFIAAAACTPVQLAAFDIWQWKTLVGNSTNSAAKQLGLPNATAQIIRDTSTDPTTFIIVVGWADKQDTLSYSLALAL